MERLQILARYDWADGCCFRHPSKGEVPTAPVGLVLPPGNGGHEVRACVGCVIAMEDMKRESSRRATGNCQPTERRSSPSSAPPREV